MQRKMVPIFSMIFLFFVVILDAYAQDAAIVHGTVSRVRGESVTIVTDEGGELTYDVGASAEVRATYPYRASKVGDLRPLSRVYVVINNGKVINLTVEEVPQ